MKVRTAFVIAAALSAVGFAPAAAQSLGGTWEISAEGRRGTQTMTLELVQEGDALTGTVSLRMGGRRGGGGGGAGERLIEIDEGAVDGSAFSFTMTLTFNDNSITQTFSGTFEDDEMEGTIEGGRGGGRPFTGTRGG